MTKEKCVLAYSGGLDTSVCIPWLIEHKNVDVISVAADVGQNCDDMDAIGQKAERSGAIESHVLDLTGEFAETVLKPAINAQALYEGQYPLVSALSRPLISKYLVEIAKHLGAKYIAHGCTGKGNDQVRFELAVRSLAPDIQIIAPVREWDLTTRDKEIEYAKQKGIEVPITKASPYSIDDNVWGRTAECGELEDPWVEPPADVFQLTRDIKNTPDQADYFEIEFDQGIPVGVVADGAKPKRGNLPEIIYSLTELAGKHGFGRLDMVENRLVGLKSREIYEVPGALSIIIARKALTELVWERDLAHEAAKLSNNWADEVYNGKWFSPYKEALDAFFLSAASVVTGTVRLKVFKGNLTVVGRKSPNSLYDFNLATYGEGDSFDAQSSAGFIDIYSLSSRVWGKKHR